jgi:hypothetical protein
VPEISRLSLHTNRKNSDRWTGRWCNWKLDEGQTIATPSDDAYNDTLPVGIALDLCNLTTAEVGIGSDEAPEQLHRKPMPALLVLSSAGVLLSFAPIDDRPGAKCDAVGPPSFPSASPPTEPSSRTPVEQVDKSYFNFQESLNIETDAVHLSDEIHENRKNEVDSSKDNSWAARKHGFQINDSDSSEESDEGDESDDFDIEIVDSDMKKLMVPRLERAMVAADHAEPTSQLRSILLEMDERDSVRSAG